MSQPTPYTVTTDFSEEEADGVAGRSTSRTAAIDVEFANIATTIAQILTNLSTIQRDDGHLRDLSVDTYNLTQTVLDLIGAGGFTPRGAWLTTTVYAIGDMVSNGTGTYVCSVAHTAGTFAIDKAAGKWVTLFDTAAYSASGISFTPTGQIASTNVQAALAEIGPGIAALKTFITAGTIAAALTAITLGTGDTPTFQGLILSHSAADNLLQIIGGTANSVGVNMLDTASPGNGGQIYTDTASRRIVLRKVLAGVGNQLATLETTFNGKILQVGGNVAAKDWGSGLRGMEFEGGGGFVGSVNDARIYGASYNKGGLGDAHTDGINPATMYQAVQGAHYFYVAPVGVTDGAASFSLGLKVGSGTAGTDLGTYVKGVLSVDSGQIAFPATQSPSGGANTLDDYEEGTFTPGISFGGGATGVTYSLQAGAYTKIGRQVYAEWRFALTAKGSSTGAVRVTGLPFTVLNASSYGHGPVYWSGMNTNISGAFAFAEANATTAQVFGNTANTAAANPLLDTYIAATTQLSGSLTYQTS